MFSFWSLQKKKDFTKRYILTSQDVNIGSGPSTRIGTVSIDTAGTD